MKNRTLLWLGLGLALLVSLAWYFSKISLYFVIAIIISTILRPLTNYLAGIQFLGMKIPRALAVFISFAFLFASLFLFVLLFVPLIADQIAVLKTLSYEGLYYRLMQPITRLEEILIENNLVSQPEGFIVESLKQMLFSFARFQNVGTLLNNLVSLTGTLFIGIMAVMFISFFLLFEKGLMRRMIISVIPNRYFEMSISALYTIEKLLSNYLIGLIFQMTAIFTLASVGLSILGVKYALTIAIFAAVANLVPYAGPLAGGIFGLIVGLSTFGDIPSGQEFTLLTIKILVVFAIIQFLDNILLQPLIFSKSVKAHPLVIFIAIFAGATIAGIGGMIAAIPVYTVLQVSGSALIDGYRKFKIFNIN